MRRRFPVGGRSGRRRGRCCLSRRINTRTRGRCGAKFRERRNEYADALFALAKRAAEAGQLSLAFQWATEAVRENPDHADARRVLGYERTTASGSLPSRKRMVDAGKKWNPQLRLDCGGGSHGRAQAGQRRLAGPHRSFSGDVEPQPGGGRRVGRPARAIAPGLAAAVRRLLSFGARGARALCRRAASPRRGTGRFACSITATRDDYVAALARRQPRIAETLGIYFDADREAHFFAGDDQDAGTLYHEAVHQLFQETRPAARHVGDAANFWIIEGVATYFETLARTSRPAGGSLLHDRRVVGRPAARGPAAAARRTGFTCRWTN